MKNFISFVLFWILLGGVLDAKEIKTKASWSNPQIIGNSLQSVWQDSPGEYIFAGEAGMVLRLNKNGEFKEKKFNRYWFSDIWGTKDGKHIFICGYNGVVLEFRDGEPVIHKTGITNDLNGIWGVDENNVYAVGDRGTIIYFNGKSWSKVETGNKNLLFDVWGSGIDSIYAVGGRGTVLFYNGKKWTKVEELNFDHYTAIYGITNDKVFIGGDTGSLSMFDGKKWQRLKAPHKGIIRKMVSNSNADLLILYDFGNLIKMDKLGNIKKRYVIDDVEVRSMAIDKGNNIILSGDGGAVIRIDANSVSHLNEGYFFDILTSLKYSEKLFFAAGRNGGFLVKEDENNWKKIESKFPTTIRDIIKLKTGEIVLVGDNRKVFSYLDGLWKVYPETGGSIFSLTFYNNKLYVAGKNGYFAFFNGKEWVNIETGIGEHIRAIYNDGAGILHLVGDSGTIIKYEDKKISVIDLGVEGNLFSIAGVSSDLIFAVGDFGNILVYREGLWKRFSSPTNYTLRAVSVLNRDTFVVAGEYGSIYLFHDGQWNKVSEITGNTLRAAEFRDENSFFVYGDSGAIIKIRFD